MTGNNRGRSIASAGEVARSPADGEAIYLTTTDSDGNLTGTLIEWKTESSEQWLWADADALMPVEQ